MTAMAMFSEDGIDAVTLRSINTSAGCSNTGAVHYHFCNKDGLIQAIIDFLQKKIWQPAFAELNVLLAQDPSLREILETALWPDRRILFEERWGVDATSFCFEISTGSHENYRSALKKIYAPHFDLLYETLNKRLKDLPEAALKQRVKFLFSEVMVGHWARTRVQRTLLIEWSKVSQEIYFNDYIDFAIGGLLAPCSNPVKN